MCELILLVHRHLSKFPIACPSAEVLNSCILPTIVHHKG